MANSTLAICFGWIESYLPRSCFARYALLSIVALLSLYSDLRAQQAPGRDCYCFPPAGKRGTTVNVTLGGTDWTPDSRFLVHDPRVRLELTGVPGPVLLHDPPYWFDIKSFANDPGLPREVSARFVIPADMPAGPVQWSVVNANGGSLGGVFLIEDTDILHEDENRSGAQSIAQFPITIAGRLRRIEEVDLYTFKAPRTGPLTLRALARALGNELNLVLSLRNDAGQLIAETHDTEGVDTALSATVEKDRTYSLAVRDLDYRGYRSFTYRISLELAPRLLGAFPSYGQKGEKKNMEFFGIGIATGSDRMESLTKEVSFPATSAGWTVPYSLSTPFGTTRDISLSLSEQPTRLRPEAPAGKSEKDPVAWSMGETMYARFTARAQTHSYAISAKKGEIWSFEIEARSLGSPVDPSLFLSSPDGKPILAMEDPMSRGNASIVYEFPADGVYRLAVRDESGRPPDRSFVYRLTAKRPEPDFRLSLGGVTGVPIGGKVDLIVNVARSVTCKEPIRLTVQGLPAGVSVPMQMTVAPGANSFTIPLECAKDAAVDAGFIEVTGMATIGGKAVTKKAEQPNPRQAMQKPLIAITMTAPFKLKAVEADGGRRIPRGSTHPAEIAIERLNGFQGEIVLDMAATQQRHRQGIRGEPLVVPPGQTKVIYPVTVPEWLETTRTSRIGLVGMAKVPDPKGTVRYLLAPMEGQITMSMEGALMKLAVGPGLEGSLDWTGVAGKPLEIPLRLARTPKLTGAVTVELIVDRTLADLVKAEALTLDDKTATAKLTVHGKADPRLSTPISATIRATGRFEGRPVVSQANITLAWENRAAATAQK